MQSSQTQCLVYNKPSIVVADFTLIKTGTSSAGHMLHEMHSTWKHIIHSLNGV